MLVRRRFCLHGLPSWSHQFNMIRGDIDAHNEGGSREPERHGDGVSGPERLSTHQSSASHLAFLYFIASRNRVERCSTYCPASPSVTSGAHVPRCRGPAMGRRGSPSSVAVPSVVDHRPSLRPAPEVSGWRLRRDAPASHVASSFVLGRTRRRHDRAVSRSASLLTTRY